MNRRTLKAEYRTDLVFDVALIREMEQLTGVAENYKTGRFDAGLGHVIDFQAAALVRGRLNPDLSVGKDVVEHAGGDAHAALVVDIVDEKTMGA